VIEWQKPVPEWLSFLPQRRNEPSGLSEAFLHGGDESATTTCVPERRHYRGQGVPRSSVAPEENRAMIGSARFFD